MVEFNPAIICGLSVGFGRLYPSPDLAFLLDHAELRDCIRVAGSIEIPDGGVGNFQRLNSAL